MELAANEWWPKRVNLKRDAMFPVHPRPLGTRVGYQALLGWLRDPAHCDRHVTHPEHMGLGGKYVGNEAGPLK